MATTQEILKAAAALGELISSHDAAKKLESVARSLQGDIEAQRILNDFNRAMQAVAEKEAAGQPIEVADKKKVENLQGAVIRNPVLRQFQTAQMDYLDLMRRVDEAIQGGPAAQPASGSPPVEGPGGLGPGIIA